MIKPKSLNYSQYDTWLVLYLNHPHIVVVHGLGFTDPESNYRSVYKPTQLDVKTDRYKPNSHGFGFPAFLQILLIIPPTNPPKTATANHPNPTPAAPSASVAQTSSSSL